VQQQAAFVESPLEKEKEHFSSILFTFRKTYEEKFSKMAKMRKNTLKIKQFNGKLHQNKKKNPKT
jgi:hypothetical protein